MIELRPASPSDVHSLFSLILESADELNARTDVTTSPEQLLADGFGERPTFECLMVWDGASAIGYALWFPMYSSWKGRRTLYLEDLYIRPYWRKQGIGTRLFHETEKIALNAQANLAWENDRSNLGLRHFFLEMGAIDRASKISFYMGKTEMRSHLGLL